MRDSGIYNSDGIREIESLPTNPENPDSPGNILSKKSLDFSVSKFIIEGYAGANAMTNRDPSKPGVFYGDGYDSQTVLHESIHFATGLGDVALANALGLKNNEGKSFADGKNREASLAIKNALNLECK